MTKKDVNSFLAKHGKDYFSKIGKIGAKSFWSKYYILPIENTKFGIFKKSDNSFVNYFGG